MLRKDSYSYKNLRPNCSGCLNSFMIMSAGHSTLHSSSCWKNTKKSNHADTSSISLCQLDIFSVSYNKCQKLWWLETMEDAICALAYGSPAGLEPAPVGFCIWAHIFHIGCPIIPRALLCCICSAKRLLKVSADLTLGRPYVLEWSIVTGFQWIFSLYMNKPQIKREFDPNSLTLLSILVLHYSLLVATLTKSWPALCFHTLHFDCSVHWGAWSVFHNAMYLQKSQNWHVYPKRNWFWNT